MVWGDKRSITFSGDCSALEDELYRGAIRDDETLIRRAKELLATIQVDDSREKTWRSCDVLAGEVTEISSFDQKRRRVYVVPGGYLMAEITRGEATVKAKGKSSCLVLGNDVTKRIAHNALKKAGFRVTTDLLKDIMAQVASATASVSSNYTLVRSSKLAPDPMAKLTDAFLHDCQAMGWKICDPL